MSFSYERFMAWRYFRGARGREEGRSFLRIITYLAVGGVAVGVGALVLALAIVRGFSQEIQQKIAGFGSHVQVQHVQSRPFGGADTLEADLARNPSVRRVDPVVQELVLLRSEADIEGAALWGTAAPNPYLRAQTVAGRFAFAADTTELPGIVLGRPLARVLSAEVGDIVTGFSIRGAASEAGASGGALPTPRFASFQVMGIYETGLAQFDELYAFTDLESARSLLDYGPGEVTRIDLTLERMQEARQAAASLDQALSFPLTARSIYQVYRNLFAWINLQQSIIPLVIGVIVLVAAFNTLGTLLIVILEKTREIGILSSIGVSARRIKRVFLWLGMLIGTVGTAIGEILALVLALIQQRYGVIPVPQEAYYVETAPIALSPWDFLWVGGATLLLCAVAAYIPARVAARLDPVRSIRLAG